MAENMTKQMFKILKTIPGTNSNNPKITENKQSGHIAHYLSVNAHILLTAHALTEIIVIIIHRN